MTQGQNINHVTTGHPRNANHLIHLLGRVAGLFEKTKHSLDLSGGEK